MKRAGWNPIRRNRNIGTPKSGHGLKNRLVIPDSSNDPRRFYEKLSNAVVVEPNGFVLFVEPPSRGFVHAVTVDDALRVLGMFPSEDVRAVRTIVFRQPTRKQRVLSCVWGRLVYFATFGGIEGPAVILEAQPKDAQVEWARSLQPDDADELDRLRDDGHEIVASRRAWIIRSDLDSTRRTQLFRTLPHEIGHYVHYDMEVNQRVETHDSDFSNHRDEYFAKPAREKEDFAHRYGREFFEQHARLGRLPFARLVDKRRMKIQGVKPEWFGVN